MIWYFIQQKDFESALLHTKALDKRLKDDGSRLFSLADVSAENENYDVAVDALKTIVKKGESSTFYVESRIKLVDVMKKKITSGKYTQQDLLDLEKNYMDVITEFGKTI